MNKELKNKLLDFVEDPYSLINNLELGFVYESENQLASAISHYLRAAEFGVDSSNKNKKLLIYESLLRAALCFDKLGRRMYVTRGLIYQAIAMMPEMPDAYLLMCKMHEKNGEWFECMAYCSSGIEALNKQKDNLGVFRFDNDSRNFDLLTNEFLYQRAISDYYSGRNMRSRIDFLELIRRPNLQRWILDASINSLNSIGYTERYNTISYNPVKSSKELFKDNNFVSFSQCMQDIFVSSLVGKNGKYLEIGSADPFGNSNTYLLERDFGWKGVSIEIDRNLVDKFNSSRRNKAFCFDAREVDYKKLLEDNGFYGDMQYLQLDCEPAQVTLSVLKRIPFDDYRFAVITYEHDAYKDNDPARQESRRFLKEKGYELIISDVAHNCMDSYEDWWVHPDLILNYIDREKLNTIKDTSEGSKCVLDIFF